MIFSVQESPPSNHAHPLPKSPLSKVYSAPPSSSADDQAEEAVPSSPTKTSKPAAPASPGAAHVKSCTSDVMQCAQFERAAERKVESDRKNENYWKERSLEKVAESDKAVKHHQSNAVIGKLSRSAEKALERYEHAAMRRLLSENLWLQCRVATQEAKVTVRDAKLASLRRRLRRRRLAGLCRWL